MSLWLHQQQGIEDVLAAIQRGERRLCVTSPTGGGKTRIMAELIDRWVEEGRKVALYTNRKLLVEQTTRVLAAHGIDHGIRASGWAEEGYFPVQVCSIQTEDARVFKGGRWRLHDADRVIVDEAHNQTGKVARRILDVHQEEGAAIVGFTATPLGLGHLYDTLLTAGTTSELRACGALVPCVHYGCDEPDLRKIGKVALGEDLSEPQAVKAMMVPGIFGRVLDWYLKLNPEGRPTILFAPGVAESVWFAEQFSAAGIPAAHIDGQEVWYDGRFERSGRGAREAILRGSRDGTVRILCNRYVLREGVDAPWLGHGIFATVFGSLQSYLQSGGRLLRAHPGIGQVTLQDHGGNWWRHGSLNADRVWSLDFTPGIVSGLREERIRAGKEREPLRCPACGLILLVPHCRCGWELKGGKKSRPVVMADGNPIEMTGDIYRPRRISQRQDAAEAWERMYYRALSPRWNATFKQAEVMFAQESNWGWPSRDLPLMPKDELDLWSKVADVPVEKLTGPPELLEKIRAYRAKRNVP